MFREIQSDLYTFHYAKNKEFNIFTPCVTLMFEKKKKKRADIKRNDIKNT